MKNNRYSEYENFILLADNCGFNSNYRSFLNFKEVCSLLNQMVNKVEDTFLHKGTIYKKKILSNDARKLLDGFFSNRCTDVHQLKLVANQLNIRI
tara:strand:+ start:1003 stop:1287 length:285 start_codon:yes stop_codon:yes gene_type:complete